jgi:4-amino-4-deoxy-L-arabinose transferase-like glycosyltransferase
LAWIFCILFFFAGLLFLPLFGIEDDEALFAQAIFHPRDELYAIHIGHSRIPIMLMSYLGTLKAWIYAPIFRIFGPGVMTMRVPMVLAGAVSIWLFYRLLCRVAGERAALIGCGLLAVDSMYLLTVCFDWGPVALQHLLLIGGMLLLVKFYQEGREMALAASFFLFGLVLWDKALAVWMLSGIGVAALVTFPRQLFALVNRRRLAIAALAFCLGALPLLTYNAKNHWVTFRGNFHRDSANIGGKARMLMQTATGGGLFGWLTAEDWQTPKAHEPDGPIRRTSARISAVFGHPRQNLHLYAFALALLLTPFAGRKGIRTILFALIAMAVAWIQMAITVNTGGSVHHTILLWPLPAFAAGVSLAAASRRLGRAGIPAVAILMAAVVLSGALVLNEYYVMGARDGGAQSWNDAIYGLSAYLKDAPARRVFCLDWGIMDPLRLLNHGRLPLSIGSDQVSKPSMSPEDRALVEQMISDPANIFIAHTKDFEFFPGASPKLAKFAEETGYSRELMTVLSDTFGRPVFELYRFRKVSAER